MARAAHPELIVPDWPAPARVRAVAATRRGGVSLGTYASLNLGDHVGDDPASVSENRRLLVQAARLPAEPHWLRQVHGSRVVHAGKSARIPEADAMIASAAGEVCAVLTADCLPVLFCDAAGRQVGAAHAGWRGLAAGILESIVGAFEALGTAPADLLVWMGPAISSAAYEVGGEVREAFLSADPGAESGFAGNPDGRWQMDLAALARRRLSRAGVQRIHGGGFCTHGDSGRFFSHRRDGVTGRQATLIWLEQGCQDS